MVVIIIIIIGGGKQTGHWDEVRYKGRCSRTDDDDNGGEEEDDVDRRNHHLGRGASEWVSRPVIERDRARERE